MCSELYHMDSLYELGRDLTGTGTLPLSINLYGRTKCQNICFATSKIIMTYSARPRHGIGNTHRYSPYGKMVHHVTITISRTLLEKSSTQGAAKKSTW